MAIPKADRELEAHTSEVLAPGERLVAATRALAVGAFEGRLGIFGELLTGALMQSLLTGESVRRAHRAGFPAAPRMVIGMTDRRLLVWKATLFTHKPVRFLGDISLERVASVSVQPAVDRRRVTIAFVDSAPVSVTAYKRDQPERFAENFHRRLAAPPVTAAPGEMPPPPVSTEVPVVPSSEMALAANVSAPSPAFVAPAYASAAAAAVAPALPPPPPPSRPPRPPARSWAMAMPVTSQSSSAASSDAQVTDQSKKCIQCGTSNPENAAFCWRCYVPFAEQLNQMAPRPAAVATPPSPATARIPGALDGAVQPTLSWAAVPAPIKTKDRSGMVTKLAVAGMVALVAFVAYGGVRDAWARYSKKHVVVPATIAGMGRIDDPALRPYVRQLETLAQQNGMTGKAAYYGFSGQARFYFAAFEYQKGTNQSADDIFADFARGYASAGKAKIDLATKSIDDQQEATFICARVRGGARGSICMWTDHDIVGFVQTIHQGIKPTHDLTAVVRFSVES